MSRKRLARFCYNLECGVLTVEGLSIAKVVRFHTSSTKIHMHENYIIVLPVNILKDVALASWVFDTTWTNIVL